MNNSSMITITNHLSAMSTTDWQHVGQ